jgi:hypothetical protein
MHWLKTRLRSSLSGLFSSGSGAPLEPATEVGIEDIRATMLALMGEGDGENKQFLHISRRIRYASDILGLWYLRGDLMGVLAGRYGEAQAREQLKTVTAMFEHMLPQGLRSRATALGAGTH